MTETRRRAKSDDTTWDGPKEKEAEIPGVPSAPYSGTTHAERMANIDDAAVRPDGRLAGVYAEDLAAERDERVRAQVENREPEAVHTAWTGVSDSDRAKVAAKVRAAAVATPSLPSTEDAGRVLVDPLAAPTPEEVKARTEEYNKRAEAAARA